MIIGGFQHFSLCDFPGTVSAVIFTQGCNFNCPFCHNKQLIPLQPVADQNVPGGTIFAYLERRQQHLAGVVVSGGEPTLQENLPDFLAELKQMGFKTKLDTNGSHPQMICHLLSNELVDYIAMDIKAPWATYSRLAGCRVPIGSIRESANLITASGLPYQFRTTWYKTLLQPSDIEAIRRQLPDPSCYVVQEYQER